MCLVYVYFMKGITPAGVVELRTRSRRNGNKNELFLFQNESGGTKNNQFVSDGLR